MLSISVCENQTLPVASGSRAWKALAAFDELWQKAGKSKVFVWGARTVKARNYVGVVQVPGVTVEILPKIDRGMEVLGDERRRAKHNLLYMLGMTGNLPFEERELAGLELKKLPLMEVLIGLFATRLIDELRRGVDRAYVPREENLPRIRGKLLMAQHLLRNAVHRERFFVGFDEFVEDTLPNRIMKATCRRLLALSSNTDNQRRLLEAAAVFDEVSDILPAPHHFDQLSLHRNNERFAPLLEFCRIVWQEQSPNPSAGDRLTFSLLFPMEELFEQFVARFIRRYAGVFALDRSDIRIQSERCRRYLLRDGRTASQSFKLQPDLLVADGGNPPRLILDTKWKCLKSDAEDRKNGVPQADIYQMYAYAHRYNCMDNLLLYPTATEVTPKTYLTQDSDDRGPRRIRVASVSLHNDLTTVSGREAFMSELREIINGRE